jgi:hypothetical protein
LEAQALVDPGDPGAGNVSLDGRPVNGWLVAMAGDVDVVVFGEGRDGRIGRLAPGRPSRDN